MEQLISQIMQRAGISEEQARETLQVVIAYVSVQLPRPVAVQVEQVLTGQGAPGLMDQAR